MMRVGSLCSGYGGLELGLSPLIDIKSEWHSEIDSGADVVMQHRFGTKNLGDLTQITNPPEVDIVTAGFPCQPVSYAGERKGIYDERWLIEDVCRIASEADARWLILENVRGLLTANNGDALARVVEAMALNGFTQWEWTTFQARHIGAPHRRDRWFCVASNPKSSNVRSEEQQNMATPTREATELGERTRSFGKWENAIQRWERIIGRLAPNPSISTSKKYDIVSPRFVEFMMGLPDGHVTDLGLTYESQMKVLGNGVVPLQATHAIKFLFNNMQGGIHNGNTIRQSS